MYGSIEFNNPFEWNVEPLRKQVWFLKQQTQIVLRFLQAKTVTSGQSKAMRQTKTKFNTI